MSKNIILKTINEVRFFKHQILSAVVLKDYKKTFLILSKQPILDIQTLKNYLIENDLNTFAKKEITTLIHLIDVYFQLENSYKELPSEDCNFNYKYENKGAGFGGGGVIFFLEVKGKFLRTNNETFDEKEPMFSYLTNFNFTSLTNRLKEINELFETQPKEYDYLGEYLKSLSIEPAFFCLTNYKQNDYDNFVLRLKQNETKYFKTFDLLESYDDKLQIKCNYIESLEIYKSKLSMLAFKEKVSDLIKLVEDCFKSYKNNISNNDSSLSENPYLGTPTNDKATDFFEFLCEHYRPDGKTQVKFVNILHFLKNHADKNHFIFNVKQKDYNKLIEKKEIIISKFSKSEKYEEEEKPILHSLENTFLKNMNK